MPARSGVLRNLGDGLLVVAAGDGGERRLIAPEIGSAPVANAAAGILVVDPDPAAFQACHAVLGGGAYALAYAADLTAARTMLAATAYDLVILELDLPDDDGLPFCREITAAAFEGRTVPRLLIHSRRAQSIDRAAGLEFGADDYVDKTCHPVEFLARVRALLRRSAASKTLAPADPPTRQVYVFDRWRYDIQSGALTTPGGAQAWLSAGDQALLNVFLVHPRELMTRARLEVALFGADQHRSGRLIDVRVVRLRRAFEACVPGGSDLIHTVR
ncbi:MAG TPA: response regulator transcription factor, partial [Phenylobacterium sp.]|nr:response regulator transcription factor [Phenylobacterium sp.]